MWLFITSRLRQWLIVAVVLPLVLKVVTMVRRRLEERNPDSKAAKGLRGIERLSRRRRAEEEDAPRRRGRGR